MVKVKVNNSDKKFLNNYIKGLRFVYTYVYSYKVRMYYNYLCCNSKDITKVIERLDKVYSFPNINFFINKYRLDRRIVIDLIKSINSLFEDYYINKNKFPSLKYFDLYKLDKDYFINNFYSLYCKYFLNCNLDVNKIYIKMNRNNELFFIFNK